ncbi:MAG TPA: S8 family serine peptidase [Acidimicrobiales bacterium]|nr:S8 family serine peptidase [Acidimicrobiales bacterium]
MFNRAPRAAASFVALATALALAFSPTTPVGADGDSAVALGPVPLSPGLRVDLASLPSDTPYGVFAHFSAPAGDGGRSHLEDFGLRVIDTFDTVNVAFATGTLGDVRALTHSPKLSYLEKNENLAFDDETDVWATRARVAQQAVAGGPYRDGSGKILDGAGVGVAIVDSGIDSPHPDLANRIAKNYKVECSLVLAYTENGRCYPDPIELEPGVPSDTTSGHGTHVAGIVAGDGTAANGTFRGVATGASLFAFGVGEGRNIFFAAQAYDFIVGEYAMFTPRIRVINNSWGNAAGTAYDPNSVISKLVARANELGATSVFTAGNSGAENDPGDADDMSSTAKDPTPGVITVANYNDNEAGSRENTLDTSSSRGKLGDPVNYPDIAAPGASITSTCNPRLSFCALGPNPAYQPYYAYMSGTSMAAPHIAGVAALLYQARPDLTPAQVEDVMQDTAHKFAGGVNAPGAYEPDPQNPGATISYDKGAGLVDVPAALNALGVAHDGRVVSPVPTVSITSPADGANADGRITVTGNAFDGVVQPKLPPAVVVADGDGGDYNGPGAADLVNLTAAEQSTGMKYTWKVRNLADLGLTNVGLRVTQKTNGLSSLTSVNITPTGVTIPAASTSNTALATSASMNLSSNTVTAFVPFANLGNPVSGSPTYAVFASSFVGAVADIAPGGTGGDVITKPRYGREQTIVRPKAIVPPAASVTLSVDGGLPVAATMSGASPSYEWTGAVDLGVLAEGVHRIVATLKLNGVTAATDTVSVVVERAVTYDVSITAPADGDTVLLRATDITGTALPSKATPAAQAVTVAVTGGAYNSGPLAVTGVANWATSFDFGILAPGPYAVTARYLADGVVVDTASVTVMVPTPTPGTEVSYAPQGLGWWRNQFSSPGKGQLTAVEADRVADRAVQLSSGYFGSRAQLLGALNPSSTTSETRAARQYAVLVLNLSAGDLSRTMSVALGLSGSERLSPSVYDVSRLGTTVDSATRWIRSQFPSGDLGGANEVATSINGGTGLV